MTRICTECRYYRLVHVFGALCDHPSAKLERFNPVDGKHTVVQRDCDWQRLTIGSCGPDGKYWEPKQPEQRGFC